MQLRIFTEPQDGADYATLLSVAQAAERARLRCVLPVRPLPDDEPGPACPGRPTPGSPWRAWPRETSRIRLGTLMSPVTFRLPGPLAIEVAQVDQMSGGRAELGLGTGWFDAEHTAYGIPFPPLARAFRPARGAAGDHHRVVGHPRGRHVLVPRHPLHAVRVAGAAQAGPAATAADPGRRRWASPDAAAGGRGSPTSTTSRSPPSQASAAAFGRVREACQDAGRDPGSLRYSAAQTVCCGRDEAELARRARAIGHQVDDLRHDAWQAHPPRSWTSWASSRTPAPTRVYLQVLDLHDLDHLELIAAGVMPQVR